MFSRKASRQLSTKSAISVLCALLCFFSAGCAYQMGSGERKVPGGYRTVAVPVFRNSTQETGVEVFFTDAFIRELQRSKVGKISDRADAQTVLEGTINKIDYVAASQSGQSLSLAIPKNAVLNTIYRIRVTSSLRLVRNSDQSILWQSDFEKETSYSTPRIGQEGLTSANALYNHSARQSAIQNLATEMMVEAHDRMMESF